MAWDVRLDAGDATDSTVVLRNGIGTPSVAPPANVTVYNGSGDNTVILHGAGQAPETADKPYQTGVRSRRPFTGVVFQRGRQDTQGTVFAKAAAFAIVTLLSDRAAFARSREVTVKFQRAPVVQVNVDQPYQTGVRSRRPFTGVIFQHGSSLAAGPAAAKAMPFTIVRPPARRRPVTHVTVLHNPAVDGNARSHQGQVTVVAAPARRRPAAHVTFLRNPQAPVAVPPAKAMPFTIVSQYAVQRARLTARPTGEVAQAAPPSVRPVPYVVSLVGKRIARPRTGRVITLRESPANFDADGSIPITTVVQQSRQFFRRPTTRVTFLRGGQVPPVAVKAMPATVASLVAERSTVRPRGSVVFLRAPLPVPPGTRPTVVSLVTERRPLVTRTGSRVAFVRNPQPQIYTKAVPAVIVSLVPERRPLVTRTFSRVFYIHGPIPPVQDVTLTATGIQSTTAFGRASIEVSPAPLGYIGARRMMPYFDRN